MALLAKNAAYKGAANSAAKSRVAQRGQVVVSFLAGRNIFPAAFGEESVLHTLSFCRCMYTKLFSREGGDGVL